MAATPPLRTAVHTPSTPLHGAKYDEHRYKSTRKSSRQSSSRTQRAIETPPPHSDDRPHKKPTTLRSAPHTYSPPSSTHSSPRKKASKSRRSRQGERSSIMNGDTSLNQTHDPSDNPSLHPPSLNPANMLPTPAKTPRKKPVQPAAVNATARVLFPARPDTVEDAMPTPRKRRNRRHVGFSLCSSMEDDDDAGSENQIQIYTDSKDKVPELDPSEDNPFYEKPGQDVPPEPSKAKSGRKRKASHTIEDNPEIEEAFDREEGMVYVFRGKKIFRKFPKDDPEPRDDSSESGGRTLTSASIKPRLLFPTPQQRREREASNIDDEEATTDMEEPQDHDMTDLEEQQVTTPVKQTVFSRHTSSTTGHATRSSTKKAALDSSPLEPQEPVDVVPYERRAKKISPFDGWARTKAGAAASGKGKKREADLMDQSDGALGHKKAKGNEVV